MDTIFDIHPEMQGLIAAKQKGSDILAPTELRAAWNSQCSRPNRKPSVEDVMFETPGIGRELTPVRI
jgi:hypothetical protein